MGILPADRPETLRRTRLSAREIARTVRIGQAWVDRCGTRWRVVQIHRADREVELRPERETRRPTFAELAGDYRQVGGA